MTGFAQDSQNTEVSGPHEWPKLTKTKLLCLGFAKFTHNVSYAAKLARPLCH